MKKINEAGGGKLTFIATIVPRASKDEILGWTSEGSLKIKIAAPPVDGAANRKLVQFLSQTLETAKSQIRIESGQHSRRKKIEAPASCKNRLLSFSDI